MATYVLLSRWTEQGIGAVEQAPARVDSIRQMFRRNGAEVKEVFLLMGRYDTMLVFDAPDDETCARLCIALGKAGNVHTETLRAFREDEFKRIVSNLPK
ncbi:MAG: GYD domain-containing protein [Candidatus Binataceae bacterium]